MSNIVLTEEQKRIVEHFGSPLRVLAGPGTGKTFCIIEKIKYLLINKKIPYSDISTITFTNAAAAELRKRLHMSGIKNDQFPHASTLHGLAMSILKNNANRIGLDVSFKPLDSFTKRILISDTEQDLKNKGIIIQRSEKYFYNKAFEQEKHQGRVPDVIITNKNKKKTYEEFKVSFQANLRFYNLLCWEDILSKTIDLIDRFTEVKEKVHLHTKYLLVDEYQDLSPLEQSFIEKICANKDGLCIVGDDDQCIYETFRFADPMGIIDFHKLHSGCRDYPITICRRCSPEVIENALKVIVNNKVRVNGKKLEAFDKSKKGFVITLTHRSKKVEKEWIVTKVKEILTKGYKEEDIMILFTDGKTAADYITALKNEGLNLNIKIKLQDIFETDHSIWLISTLRLLVNLLDNLSLRHCLDYCEGIGSETVWQLRLNAIAAKCSLWEVVENVSKNLSAFQKIRQRNKVKKFYDFIKSLQNIKQYSEIIEIYFQQIPDSKSDKGCQLIVEYMRTFDGKEDIVSFKEILEDLEQKIEYGELVEKIKTDEKGIRIMSMHSAKGCESPIVFIPALEDDVMPGVYAENIEEKRRLFYVSMTRAKVGAFLSWARQRTGQEIHMHGRKMLDKKKSRFLDEMGQ